MSFRSDIPARIKASITAREVLEGYGFEVDRHGKCRCPFHNEKTASFQCYPGEKGWYCFGCKKGGDVIKLVMELEHLPFAAAMQSIDARFGLGIISNTPPPRDSEASRKVRERKQHRAEYRRREAEFASCVGKPERRDRMEYLDYWLTEHSDWR